MDQAVFFDRDGTLIKDKNYLDDPDGVEWFRGVFDALRELQQHDFGLFIVTNRSGGARGKFTEDARWRIMA